jgi:hypothetical protein
MIACGAGLLALAACGPAPEALPRYWNTLPTVSEDAGQDQAPGLSSGGSGTPGGIAGFGSGGGRVGAGGGSGLGGSGGSGGASGSGGGLVPGFGAGGRPPVDAYVPPDRPPPLPVDARPDRPPGPPAAATCQVQIQVRTVTTDDGYSPRNIGVIWIADADGRWVKTLKRWANRRLSHLVEWRAVTAKAGAGGDMTDAVSGATLSTHRLHTATWNCTDRLRQPRPLDFYRVVFEMTETNSDKDDPGELHAVELDLAEPTFDRTYPDAEYFTDIKISKRP